MEKHTYMVTLTFGGGPVIDHQQVVEHIRDALIMQADGQGIAPEDENNHMQSVKVQSELNPQFEAGGSWETYKGWVLE